MIACNTNPLGHIFVGEGQNAKPVFGEAYGRASYLRALAHRYDQNSRYTNLHVDDLDTTHRWSQLDVGKRFVGYEVPNEFGRGLVFDVEVVAVFDQSVVSLKLHEAFDLTIDSDGYDTRTDLGPFHQHAKFEIDAGRPFTEDDMERVWALFGDEMAAQVLRVFLALQSWALQPQDPERSRQLASGTM